MPRHPSTKEPGRLSTLFALASERKLAGPTASAPSEPDAGTDVDTAQNNKTETGPTEKWRPQRTGRDNRRPQAPWKKDLSQNMKCRSLSTGINSPSGKDKRALIHPKYRRMGPQVLPPTRGGQCCHNEAALIKADANARHLAK